MFILFWAILLSRMGTSALPFSKRSGKSIALIVSFPPFSLFFALCTTIDQIRVSPLLELHAWNKDLGISLKFYIVGLSIYFGSLISGMGMPLIK